MLKTVAKTIRQHNMLSHGDGVVVGLSGGADSVTLLSALMALGDEMDLSIYAVHINHNLRGEAAKEDENFVWRLCDDADVPLIVFSADVQGFAKEEKLSIEEAGRKLRYKYLHEALDNFDAQKIAVGHNQDDNAETVLLNLFRGTGLKGLGGIPPVNGKIIRPLIDVSRKSIEKYAADSALAFITDETNASLDYSRNYIRNEIIPMICKQFGDGVPATIARNASLLMAEEEALAAAAWDKLHVLKQEKEHQTPQTSSVNFPIDKLLSYPLAISRRIIREAISQLRENLALGDIQALHIESILDIAKGRTGREISLPGIKARREYTNLVLWKNHMAKANSMRNSPDQAKNPGRSNGFPATDRTDFESICHRLLPDTPVCIQLCSQDPVTITLSFTGPQNQGQTHCTQAFNYDKVNGYMGIRTRRPGDKINLPGGTKKLQDYFTDTKTPRIQREQVLLLADGSNILWIMDKHNRTSVAYQPEEGQTTCWVTVQRKD